MPKPTPPKYLYDIVKKKIDLAEFLETEIGCDLYWLREDLNAKCLCPIHNDSQPSFHIEYVDEEVWMYYCFGCGRNGTVIDFFMDYYGHDHPSEALLAICEKFGFKDSQDLVVKYLGQIKREVGAHKKIEFTNVVTSNQCRMLLRKNFSRYNKWVAATYKRMNQALEEQDLEAMEQINAEVFKKMREKNDDE